MIALCQRRYSQIGDKPQCPWKFAKHSESNLANASPEAKRLHDDGALFIGHIKSFVIEEKTIIPKDE